MQPAYRITTVTPDNVDEHGLFCLKSKQKEEGYRRKLAWFRKHYDEGVRVKLLEVYEGEKKGYNSKGLIEYAPGRASWRGVEAPNWTVIHCIWVPGQHKGKGYGSLLLDECVRDSVGRDGVAVATTSRTWLPHRDLFVKRGFVKVDELMEFELYALRLKEDAAAPRFLQPGPVPSREGFTVYVSYQCPYHVDAARIVEERAEELGAPFTLHEICSAEEAQRIPHPHGVYALCRDGKLVTYTYTLKKDIPG